MRCKIRLQLRIVTVLCLAVILYNESLVYVIQSYKWSKLECPSQNPAHCVSLLLVADPQILGEQSEDAPLRYLFNWDSDRYLYKTFGQVASMFTPDVVVFLGDLMDEGTLASKQEFHSYIKRLLNIFVTQYPTKHVWIPGDNDIGGENEPIYPDKLNQFNSAFVQTDIVDVKNVDVYKVNLILQKLPQLPAGHAITKNRTNIVVSHMPLLLSPGRFTENVVNRFQPSVMFSGHKHTALHLETTMESMFVSKVLALTPQDEHKIIRVDFKQEAYHEFVVPTCSYRMGVPNMGYGIAIIDTHNQNLQYTIWWSPRRFYQLHLYAISLLLLFSFLVYTLFTRTCWKNVQVVKLSKV